MFRFRLETLLRLRIAERDERRADLAKALRAEAVLEEEREKLGDEYREVASRDRALKSPGAANVDGLMQNHRYQVVLVSRQRQLDAQMEQVKAESDKRRLALVEADRQVRVLEKLRERQAIAFRQQEERRQAKQFDEAASINHSRQQEALS
jgi:flagellar FliJ protein